MNSVVISPASGSPSQEILIETLNNHKFIMECLRFWYEHDRQAFSIVTSPKCHISGETVTRLILGTNALGEYDPLPSFTADIVWKGSLAQFKEKMVLCRSGLTFDLYRSRGNPNLLFRLYHSEWPQSPFAHLRYQFGMLQEDVENDEEFIGAVMLSDRSFEEWRKMGVSTCFAGATAEEVRHWSTMGIPIKLEQNSVDRVTGKPILPLLSSPSEKDQDCQDCGYIKDDCVCDVPQLDESCQCGDDSASDEIGNCDEEDFSVEEGMSETTVHHLDIAGEHVYFLTGEENQPEVIHFWMERDHTLWGGEYDVTDEGLTLLRPYLLPREGVPDTPVLFPRVKICGTTPTIVWEMEFQSCLYHLSNEMVIRLMDQARRED